MVFISASMGVEQVRAGFAAGGDACASKMRMRTGLIHAITGRLLEGRLSLSDEC
jgi:hypothetical protein